MANLGRPLIALYILINAMGTGEAIFWYNSTASNCSKPFRKVELVFPGYSLGCWLSTPLLSPKKEG